LGKLKKDKKDGGEGGAEKKWIWGHDWRLAMEYCQMPLATWLHFKTWNEKTFVALLLNIIGIYN
jgi:hypothetical protein